MSSTRTSAAGLTAVMLARVALARAVPATLLLLAALVGVAPPPAGADDAAPARATSVTFPPVVALNPTTTPYAVQVDTDEYDTVSARWGSQWASDQPLDPHGSTEVDLSPEGDASVYVVGCLAESCTTIATSPVLHVHSSLDVQAWAPSYVRPRPVSLGLRSSWIPPPGEGTATWQLTAPGADTPVLHGTSDFVVPDRADYGFPLVVDLAGAPEGSFTLAAHLDYEAERFGPLPDDVTVEVEVDDTSPTFLRADLSGDVVYPADDDYLDFVRVHARTDESAAVRLEVLDHDGTVVHVANIHQGSDRWVPPHRGAHPLVGDFEVRLVATDPAGNRTERDLGPMHVGTERLQRVEWERTVRAGSVMGGTAVGRCSTLKRPSSHGGAGSLGFVTLTRCSDRSQGHIAAAFGAALPAGFTPTKHTRNDRYRGLRITVVGGAARGTRSAALDLAFQDRRHRLARPARLDGTWGEHPGDTVRSPNHDLVSLDSATGRHHVVWQLDAPAGTRYDVSKFRIRVLRWALR
ncbi:hypothetical protein [Nocardioides acrostichi]|uniref:Ig-like domain-containing protein n=1 Tax=Nocardioides acrostichi TaxID=2784339 RepID=A0A930V0C6_9ACTN|nr:hypothetical protein [Nocardioides acrostichi]MBF4160909.1 hypothetical protein [Nocardioides acrostichi]